MSTFNFTPPVTNIPFGSNTPTFSSPQQQPTNITPGTVLNKTIQPSLTFGNATTFGGNVAQTSLAPALGTGTTAPTTVFGTTIPPVSISTPFGGIQSTVAPPTFGSTMPTFGSSNSAPPAFGSIVTANTTAPIFSATNPSVPTFGGVQPTVTQSLNFSGFGGGNQPASTIPLVGTPTITGAPIAATQPTLTLGVTPATAAATITATSIGGGFNFSAPSTGIGGLGFPTTSTTAGATVTPAITSGFFGTKTTASAFPSLNTTTTVSSTGSGLLAGALVPTLAGAAIANSAPSTITTKVGLGGIDLNATQPKTIEGRTESARAKEAQLPQEILTTVHALQQHIDQQKSITSDIARKSKNVNDEIQSLNWSLADISNAVENNYAAIKSLRSETAVAVRQAEMAQRTQQTPSGLQFENTAPIQYFIELIQKYEADMITFRNQVELTEKYMCSLASPQSFSADDLKRGLHQIHESFIALAGRLHETHQKVEVQKEQYLNLRKHLFKDTTNIFAENEQQSPTTNRLPNTAVTFGPTPFTAMMNIGNLTSSSSRNTVAWSQSIGKNAADNPTQNQGITFGSTLNQSTIAGSTFNLGAGVGGTQFSNAFGTSSTFNSGTDGSFNLQKPPVGGKRNKH